jgi:hypothetical protein
MTRIGMAVLSPGTLAASMYPPIQPLNQSRSDDISKIAVIEKVSCWTWRGYMMRLSRTISSVAMILMPKSIAMTGTVIGYL